MPPREGFHARGLAGQPWGRVGWRCCGCLGADVGRRGPAGWSVAAAGEGDHTSGVAVGSSHPPCITHCLIIGPLVHASIRDDTTLTLTCINPIKVVTCVIS